MLQEGLALPQQGLLKSASEEPAASDHTLCVQFRKTQVHLPNSGYNPDCSGLFFLPFPNHIWACSLKGEVVRSDWPGPSARSQETAPTSLPRVALSSVLRAQPPYPNGKAASPGCVSVSTGHLGHTGWRGAGPRPWKLEPGRRSRLSAHNPVSESEL